MRLRVRAAGAAASDTFKVEVPAGCSLHRLEDAIAESLQSRGVAVHRPLKISLNKTEPIEGHDASLLSQFGICNGDLLFYFESSAFSGDSKGALDLGVASMNTAGMRRELCAAAAARRACMIKHPERELESVGAFSSTSMVDEPEIRASTTMHIDEPASSTAISASTDIHLDGANSPQEMLDDDVLASQGRPSNSIPAILQRILNAEHSNLSRPSDFLILSVHAVMLETGFIVLNAVEDGHSLPAGWANGGVANICYTLRDLQKAGNGIGNVVLKSLTLGGNVIICGTIAGGGLPPWKLALTTVKHISGTAIAHDDLLSAFVDIFELWKCAKDELSLPLLTALCERAGLPPPSSLLVLPTELKMKILEFLPALNLVKVGCTCSELRHLSANDELWKKLFDHDFGNPSAAQQSPSFQGWKSAYAGRYVDKKRMLERRPRHVYRPFGGFGPRSGFPHIIGGDYDIYPPFGGGPFRSGFGVGRGPLGGLHGRLRYNY